ncbi:MAG TPA: hypothetical protein VFT29_16725 [Gemmatimonadaceae bacterium]|nr:hypothetical protein [Gemmatimonadaceae bacterium]
MVPPQHTRDDEDPALQLSAAALLEWKNNVEILIRGIAHALNNRAAALSAVIELSRDVEDSDDDPEATRSILSAELSRVTELAKVMRTIGRPRPGVEAFAPSDAADESLAVLQLYLDQRDNPVTIDAAGAPPVRVQRWMFVRALIALGAAASNGGSHTGGTSVRISITADGDWVRTRIDGMTAPTAQFSPYAAELARAMGGELLQGQLGFRVPSLTAVRQREAL